MTILGLIIGKLNFKEKIYSFTGYLDQDATKKKYLYDVLHRGDAYFNSGDIVVMDDLGYFYFRDRTGDTFRYFEFVIISKFDIHIAWYVSDGVGKMYRRQK